MHGRWPWGCMVAGGCAWLLVGGMCGCWWGVCMVAGGGHVWLPGGTCVVAGGGHVWLRQGGMCGCWWGACMVGGRGGMVVGGYVWQRGVCMAKGGHAWDTTTYGDTINERVVRILLECIVVFIFFWCRQMLTSQMGFVALNTGVLMAITNIAVAATV